MGDEDASDADDSDTQTESSDSLSAFGDSEDTSDDSEDTADADDNSDDSLQEGDTVEVQYKLSLADGTPVYTQWGPGNGGTFSFELGGGHVIPGFDNAVSQMSVGETKDVDIPASEGYGSKGFKAMGIPPNADLHYTLKVVSKS